MRSLSQKESVRVGIFLAHGLVLFLSPHVLVKIKIVLNHELKKTKTNHHHDMLWALRVVIWC